MTLHDVRILSNYANKHLPLRVLVTLCAAALGVKVPEMQEAKQSKYLTSEELRAIVQATQGKVPGMGGPLG